MTGQKNNCRKSEIYRQYHAEITHYIFSKTGQSALAEDLCQDCFMRLFRHYDRDNIQSVRAYLYRIALNIITDHYRSGAMRYAPVALEGVPANHDALQEKGDPENDASLRNYIGYLADGLESLSGNCQRVFWMSRFYGYTNKEIAENEGVSLSTVEKYISKAKRQCQSLRQVEAAAMLG